MPPINPNAVAAEVAGRAVQSYEIQTQALEERDRVLLRGLIAAEVLEALGRAIGQPIEAPRPMPAPVLPYSLEAGTLAHDTAAEVADEYERADVAAELNAVQRNALADAAHRAIAPLAAELVAARKEVAQLRGQRLEAVRASADTPEAPSALPLGARLENAAGAAADEVLATFDRLAHPEAARELTKRQRVLVGDAAYTVITKLVRNGWAKGAPASPRPGDVVRLRSGGPLMSVQNVIEPTDTARKMGQHVPAVQVAWIDRKGKPQQTAVGAPALELADKRAPELLEAALGLWAVKAEHQGEHRGAFDYAQGPGGHRAVEHFLAALNSYDGGDRAWPFGGEDD